MVNYQNGSQIAEGIISMMLRCWTDLDLAYYTEPTNLPNPPQMNNYYCINDIFNLFERVQF